MCGIAGIFNVAGQSVSEPLLKRMIDKVKYRGPDSAGTWCENFIGFGHCRLAILDISYAGHQPMMNSSGNIIITYSGEVYNYQNIRIELESKGYTFKSNTDTEVVLKAYEEWGVESVHKFNGMFAYAIWDKRINKLFLFRDRYGIIPVYYYYKNSTFIFASEIKSILEHPQVKHDICLPALNEYFSFQNIFSDLTLFKGIKILMPGHYIALSMDDTNSFKLIKYWDFDFSDEIKFKDEQECIDELTRLFENAVNRHLISDVEVGAYLSGGIDSGAITAVASKTFKNLKSFTSGFDLSSASGLELSFDEREKAEFLSNLYKTEHYEVVLKAGDMERVMKDLIWHLEDLRIGQCYPNYYVSRLAGKFVKVVLAGTGGDELFAGYPWRYFSAVTTDSIDNYADNYYEYWQRLVPDTMKKDFFQPEIFSQIKDYSTKDIFHSVIKKDKPNISFPEEYVNRSLYFETKTFLHGLLTVENKICMAHSLETRTPFLDNELVDFAMKIPIKYKLKNLNKIIKLNENEAGDKIRKYFQETGEGKVILRKVLNKYVPDNYAQGRKQGFSAPDASWFKGESIGYIKELLYNKKAWIHNYLNPVTTRELLEEHFDGKINHRLLIWSLLSFEWWCKIFL